MPVRPTIPTEGARQLAAWLRDNDLSITRFCEANGLDRVQVQRAIKGERQRYSVDFALRIERATRGRVKVATWARASETRRRRAA